MKKSKSERAKLADKLDKIDREIILIRDGHKCQYCDVYIEGANAHCSHVVPKGVGASWRRFDLRNLKLLCYHHHINWWHMQPTEAGPWFKAKFPGRDKYLDKYRHGKTAKITTPEMRELLEQRKEKLKLLQGEGDGS
jgi:5-methylcytosine-specific restriction endonuclease McrA